jgi:hypothetical protein
MPLDAREKERARYHLGYLAVQPAASIQFGIPRPIQTMFLVETALNNVIEEAVDRVRRILKILDDTEARMVEAQDRLAAIALDTLKLRENEPDLLEREYCRWAFRLADILGVPTYYYSTKFRSFSGVKAGSIPVR